MGDRGIRYQPGLDGMRALAVSAVLLYHLGGTVRDATAGGGFLGVDIFFVLSGYLITTLLLEERFDTGRIRLPAFWGRRARRLLPALAVLLVLVAVLGHFAYRDIEGAWARSDVAWVLTFSQNWHLALFGAVLRSPLSAMWSLSVEEQFYLLWPLVLLGLVAVLGPGRRRLFAVMVGLVVVGGVWAASRYSVAGPSTYFATDTRAPELFVGAALAVLGAGRGLEVPLRWRRPVDVGGLVVLGALVLALVFLGEGSGWYYGGFVMLAVATAFVIVAAVQPGGMVRKVLGLPVLVAVGRISYGLYLFHLPVYLWIGRWGSVGPLTRIALRIGISVVLATLSYLLVEQPIRQRRIPARVWVPAATVAAAVALFGITRLEPLPATPRSPVLAYALSSVSREAPEMGKRVLIVGGQRIAVFGLASQGPRRLAGVYGYAVGSAGCGLLAGAPQCRAVPDDLAAMAGTLDADTVVLVPDEADLAASEAGTLDLGRGLDRLQQQVGDRRLVIVRLPCGADPSAARSEFDTALKRWAARHDAVVADSPFVGCESGRPVTATTNQAWAALGRLAR